MLATLRVDTLLPSHMHATLPPFAAAAMLMFFCYALPPRLMPPLRVARMPRQQPNGDNKW